MYIYITIHIYTSNKDQQLPEELKEDEIQILEETVQMQSQQIQAKNIPQT